jgi:transposase
MSTVTVLTGPERRRRWASSEKARIVEESLRTAVAQRHDVHPNLLHHWRRQAKRAAGSSGRINFLPVAVTAQRGLASMGPASMAEGSIEIELAGNVRVRVDAAVDEAALGRVLRALGR